MRKSTRDTFDLKNGPGSKTEPPQVADVSRVPAADFAAL